MGTRRLQSDLRYMKWLLLSLCSAFALSGQIVISQIHGGGGNNDGVLSNDYVELFNPGVQPVALSGWTLQYASAAGSSWDRVLLSGSITPGRRMLIVLFGGPKPLPDIAGGDLRAGLNIHHESGKLALVAGSSNLQGSNPAGPIVDFIGYGAANVARGRPAPASDHHLALVRRDGGCADTKNNQGDFFTATPQPRGGFAPAALCAGTPPPVLSQASPTLEGVAHAASFESGWLAPGVIATIFGKGLGPSQLATMQVVQGKAARILAGVAVLVDGQPTPLIYVSANQISFVVPYGTDRPSVTIVVDNAGKVSRPFPVSIAPVLPGLFTRDSSGQGPVAATHADGALVGEARPVRPGDVVILYGTGFGELRQPGVDGALVDRTLPVPRGEVRVWLDDRELDVLYAGGSPGLINAVTQVNVRVPLDSALGTGATPLRLQVGSRATRPGLYLFTAPTF